MPRGGEGRPDREPGSVTFIYHSCSLSNKFLVTAEGESLDRDAQEKALRLRMNVSEPRARVLKKRRY